LGARPKQVMRQFELVERVLAYNPHADEALLNRAYVYAMQKHGAQLRASGDPYFAHPLEVAGILTDLKLDDATIAVALLHDTIEDTDATRAEIDQLFGVQIGEIVDGLTKIERLNLVTREKAQAENLRKLLLAISQDVRVLLVKLADRLHNMRTISFVPEEKRQRIAQETMDIYAPLAGRMGMQDMRSELEDLAFQVLQPSQSKTITGRLARMEDENRDIIAKISEELSQKLKSRGISARVQARLKHPWSIFRKIEQKEIALEQLSDIIGFRVIVENVDECYATLGVVHACWKMVPGRFKDYISVPKYNDYRSIHTTIVGPGRQRVELQIRTEEMHNVAEYGVAGHALYKDNVNANFKRLEKESHAYNWLRSTIEHLTTGSNSEEFLEYTKLELFQDQVFCFTPRGRLIALPRGATPIDFAYAVHTDVGDTCVGSKINGTISPIVTQLRNGDEVEIIRDQNHAPPTQWQSIAVTGKARSAIRRSVRAEEQKRTNVLGDQVLSMLLQREGVEDEEIAAARLAEELGFEDKAELVTAIGKGDINAADMQKHVAKLGPRRRRLFPRRKITLPVPKKADGWFSLRANPDFRFRVPGGQRLRSKGKAALAKLDFNTEVEISPEGVVPGDRMVGILATDGVLGIYPIHSDALIKKYDEDVAWIDVLWDTNTSEDATFGVAVSMLAANKPGMLAQATATIASCDTNIHNLALHMVSPDFYQLVFRLEVRDLVQLTDALSTLKHAAGLQKVQRALYDEASAISRIDWQRKEAGK
jgi:GTP diphosphokinase / guanosine-3',5'-bis(diphosphate) 3'-diphosphatase